MSIGRLDMCICTVCKASFNNKYMGEVHFNKKKELHTKFCKECKKIKKCKNCNIEFKHRQNQTCSKQCAEELKKKSYIKSCGTTHNFCKNSKSRKKWESRLLEDEGITNVFQRDEVKLKIRNTMNERYGGWFSSTKYGKEKIRNIFLEKYGRWIGLDIPEIYEAYVNTCKERWGSRHWGQSEKGREILSKAVSDARNSKKFKDKQILNGNWKDHSNLEEINSYYFYVYKITEENLEAYGANKFGDNWEIKRSRRDHHIDHVYPIIKSFYMGIPPELVGSIKNLELIPASENLSKGTKITEIPTNIKKWINENKKNK